MGRGCGSVCGKAVDQTKDTGAAPTPQPAKSATSSAPVTKQAETIYVAEAPPEPKAITPSPVTEVAATAPFTAPVVNEESSKMAKIYIIFYSMYGHVYTMAQAIKEGVDSVEGAEGILYQVPETLPAEVLEKMHAPPKPDVPIIDRDDLPNADGFIFGIPTRFGMMASQLKAFFDSTGQHWQSGALVGKPASVFVSTATQNGGQETTALTAVTQLVHHGMIFVPPGYSYGGTMFDLESAHAGGPWGAGTFAGPTGAAQPTEHDLGFAKHQGAHLAKIALKLKA